MKKQMKTVCCLVTVLMLFFMNVTVFAADNNAELGRSGSLTLILKDAENSIPLTDAEIGVYQVADITGYNSVPEYALAPAFAESEISLDNLDNPALADKFYDYAANHSIEAVSAVVDENGNARFDTLSIGIYLVVQTKGVDGYTDFEPFLISIPQIENDNWSYNVVAVPKTGALRLIDLEVHKVWSDSGENRPESVKIQLLKNGKPIETVTLNEQNEWQYRWKQLRSDEDWSVCEIDIPKGYTVSYKQDGTVFTVTNVSSLIKTGQLNWPIPVLTCTGLFCILIGWVLYSEQRKKRHE